jgi:anti-anti-sigma factor
MELIMSSEPSSDPVSTAAYHRMTILHHTNGPGPARVVIRGEVDALGADHLRHAVTEVLRDPRPSRINLDLRGVTYLDSAGLRALLQCKADAQWADSELEITTASDRAHHVLDICGLRDHFGLTEPHRRPEPGE